MQSVISRNIIEVLIRESGKCEDSVIQETVPSTGTFTLKNIVENNEQII